MINYTATYRVDSDLVAPYERVTLNANVPDAQKQQHRRALISQKPKTNYSAGRYNIFLNKTLKRVIK
jgi:hypothetical protein